jgi:two-component system phosphate regulon sensor histidine kinase PhoR
LVENIDHRLGLAGNAAILRMIFANLINNALNHAGVDARIAVTWRREDNEAIFQIMDNGRGIEAEHLPRLTERFYRADSGRSRESGGTGLGLAIVKHALERHDAALHIESAPGEGSAFTCRFPAMRVVGLAARPSLIRRGRRRDVTLC